MAVLFCLLKIEFGTLPSPALAHLPSNWNADVCPRFHQPSANSPGCSRKVRDAMGAEAGAGCSAKLSILQDLMGGFGRKREQGSQKKHEEKGDVRCFEGAYIWGHDLA